MKLVEIIDRALNTPLVNDEPVNVEQFGEKALPDGVRQSLFNIQGRMEGLINTDDPSRIWALSKAYSRILTYCSRRGYDRQEIGDFHHEHMEILNSDKRFLIAYHDNTND